MAERLVADSKEIDDFVCDKSAKNCCDKINNLSKKYKTVKDKSKPTVEGSKDLSIHGTNLKYCGKWPKIRFLSYFRIL